MWSFSFFFLIIGGNYRSLKTIWSILQMHRNNNVFLSKNLSKYFSTERPEVRAPTELFTESSRLFKCSFNARLSWIQIDHGFFQSAAVHRAPCTCVAFRERLNAGPSTICSFTKFKIQSSAVNKKEKEILRVWFLNWSLFLQRPIRTKASFKRSQPNHKYSNKGFLILEFSLQHPNIMFNVGRNPRSDDWKDQI